jgi:cytochrome bd-type quinol oxidase subunit 2
MTSMPLVDVWASAAALIGCIAAGVRAEMLRHEIKSFCDAPWWVHLSLTVLSVVMGTVFISCMRGGHSTQREAFAYTAFAFTSSVFLVNLWMQGRKNDPP